jgi:parallel beta-helix repeat protein
MNGDHNTVRNCWVHNNSSMGVAMHDQKDCVIENNLIEFNGQHIQFHHGVYADGDGFVIRNNIVRYNAGFGLQLYPSMKNARVENNLICGQKEKPGIILSCPEGGGHNVISNNTIVGNRGGITIWQGDGETVMNNILVSDREDRDTLQFSEGTKQVNSDYNFCVPASPNRGPHGFTGDPMFVDPKLGLYWLKRDSPAIGKGLAQYAPDTDFWGRPVAKDRTPDLGCFPFVPILAAEQTRATWRSGWPFRFSPDPGNEIPDLWSLPVEVAPQK